MSDLEIALVDGQLRNLLERSEVSVLPLRHARVIRTCTYASSEVPDALDLVPGQQATTEQADIEPFVAGTAALQRPEEQIEAVDIDVCPQSVHRVRRRVCRRSPDSVTIQKDHPLRFGLTDRFC